MNGHERATISRAAWSTWLSRHASRPRVVLISELQPRLGWPAMCCWQAVAAAVRGAQPHDTRKDRVPVDLPALPESAADLIRFLRVIETLPWGMSSR